MRFSMHEETRSWACQFGDAGRAAWAGAGAAPREEDVPGNQCDHGLRTNVLRDVGRKAGEAARARRRGTSWRSAEGDRASSDGEAGAAGAALGLRPMPGSASASVCALGAPG